MTKKERAKAAKRAKETAASASNNTTQSVQSANTCKLRIAFTKGSTGQPSTWDVFNRKASASATFDADFTTYQGKCITALQQARIASQGDSGETSILSSRFTGERWPNMATVRSTINDWARSTVNGEYGEWPGGTLKVLKADFAETQGTRGTKTLLIDVDIIKPDDGTTGTVFDTEQENTGQQSGQSNA